MHRTQYQRQNSKYWRPLMLLIVPEKQPLLSPLCLCCDRMASRGLLIIGRPIIGEGLPAAACAAAPSTVAGPPASRRLPRRRSTWETADIGSASDSGERVLHAFEQLTVATSLRPALINLGISAGLGGLTPHTIVVPLLTSRQPALSNGTEYNLPVSSAAEYVNGLADMLLLPKQLIISANFESSGGEGAGSSTVSLSCSPRGAGVCSASNIVDVWIFGEIPARECATFTAELSLAVQYAFLAVDALRSAKVASRCVGKCFDKRTTAAAVPMPRLRLIQLRPAPGIADANDAGGMALPAARPAIDEAEETLRAWVAQARVSAEVVVLESAAPSLSAVGNVTDWSWMYLPGVVQAINEAMRAESGHSHSALAFLLLPPPPSQDSSFSADRYLQAIRDLTNGLPPAFLTKSATTEPVITTEI